jgi:flagellar basal-body rod modification protein FlgD
MSAPSSLTNSISNSKYAVSPVTKVSQNNGQISMQQFLVLLTTELQHQDPTQPMDDASFFGQMAQLNTAQGMQNLDQQSQIMEAQNLMGQVVTAVKPYTPGQSLTDNTVTGTVSGLSIQNGVYYLNIQDASGGTTQVQMSAIQSIAQGVTNVTNPGQLIGSFVSGPNSAGTGNASGQVIGLTVSNGKTLLEVKQSDGTTTTMDPSQVSNVATTASGN